MSHNDLFETITSFLVELRGRGHFLPYEEQEIVRHWANAAEGLNGEKVILILTDLISQQRDKNTTDRPVPLKLIDKKFLAKIAQLKA